MEKFNELLEELQDLTIEQDSIDWEEDIPEDLWNKYFKDNFKTVGYNLEIDTHRWYEISTTVIEILNGFIGIVHITKLFSESMMVFDCNHTVGFKEMVEVSTVTYKSKI